MKNIYKTSEIVKRVLEMYPETRNSDDLLYRQVCLQISPVVRMCPFEVVLRERKELGLPPFESVRRTRQKIQRHHPELAGCAVVEAQRVVNEQIVKDYARKVDI